MVNALELLTTRRSFKAVELSGPAPSAAEIDTLLTVAAQGAGSRQARPLALHPV